MAKVRFIPEPGTPHEQSQFGIAWGREPVEVTDAKILAKCAGSPFYEVLPDEPAATDGLRATHNGGGRFIIVYGDAETDVLRGLTKADADAFNALSDDDKAAYVEANKAPAP